uniref:ABC transporter domain-containing protein n=1 Tax=Desulfobacca acetoxidans TaxID=60893 RepID=A0A7C3V6P1_9BACT
MRLEQVLLPGASGPWPAPLDLALELQEVLLIEGPDPEESRPLMAVAASLRAPAAGRVWHWGLEAFKLAREERCLLRRRIAYIAPGQVLIRRLTLAKNIALGPCYYEGISTQEVLAAHAGLLEQLNLQPFLDLLPDEVEAGIYKRALWARELIKEPALILAAMGAWEEPLREAGAGSLVLQEYLASRGGAALLLGRSLEAFYPLASRVLRLQPGRLTSKPLPAHPGRPLTDFLPLVPEQG